MVGRSRRCESRAPPDRPPATPHSPSARDAHCAQSPRSRSPPSAITFCLSSSAAWRMRCSSAADSRSAAARISRHFAVQLLQPRLDIAEPARGVGAGRLRLTNTFLNGRCAFAEGLRQFRLQQHIAEDEEAPRKFRIPTIRVKKHPDRVPASLPHFSAVCAACSVVLARISPMPALASSSTASLGLRSLRCFGGTVLPASCECLLQQHEDRQAINSDCGPASQEFTPHAAPPAAGADPAGFRMVRIMSDASRWVSACKPARAAAMSCSIAALACRICSWAPDALPRGPACATAAPVDVALPAP